MATKERPTRKTGACVRDCQSYRVKPGLFQRTHIQFNKSFSKEKHTETFHSSLFTLNSFKNASTV